MSRNTELLCKYHKIHKGRFSSTEACRSLPGLLENTPILRVRHNANRITLLILTWSQTLEREQEELNQYDAKVYRASKAMVESQTSSLKVLGVPFFGVRPHLLASDDENIALGPDGAPTKITQDQVLELQRKMLTHLLDLYGD